MSVFEQIKKLLNEQSIEYTVTEHEEVRTSEDAARVRGVDLNTGTKAMVVKAKEQYSLIVVPADRRIDWKKLKKLLGVSEVRFATEEEAESITKVKMGSVPPFGNLLNLKTYYDKGIMDIDKVNFNPGSKTHSIQMSAKDLISLVKPEIVEVT